jgi:uncharacterized membrane protein YqaE (UPF0057 family)
VTGRAVVRTPGAVTASLLLPPLGLHLAGAGTRDFWAGTLLTALGFVPGVVFALHTLFIRQPQIA